MAFYAIINNNLITGKGQCPCEGEGIFSVEITQEIYNNLDHYIYSEGEIILDPDYEEKQAQKEAERIQELYMTRSDFFDGMIMAFGLDSKELRVIVENVLGSINITPVQIRVALNNYDNALNFYRKHTLFKLINNVKIPVDETTYLLFTPEIWDGFFETKDYTELQKAIHEVEPESEDEDV